MKRGGWLERKTPISRSKMKKRTRRPKKGDDKAYRDWIKTLPCCVTGTPAPSDPSHLRSVKHGSGMGLKTNDRTCIPMSREVHDEYEQHTGRFNGWSQEKREVWHLRKASEYVAWYVRERERKAS